MIRGLRLFCLYIFLIQFVKCQAWQKISTKRDVMYQIIYLEVNETIDSVELAATSILQCTYKCQRRLSESFYYVEIDGRCFCNNSTGSNSNAGDSSKPKVIYGEFRSEEHTNLKYGISLSLMTSKSFRHTDNVKILSNYFKAFEYQNFKKWLIGPEGYDCRHYYLAGYGTDGVYSIKPNGKSSFEVWCDMSNGGWTVFQNRFDGSVDFSRDWQEYRDGFGELTGEFWLGLEYLHYLTAVSGEVLMEMTAVQGQTPNNAYLKLYNFTIGGPETNYILTHGNAVSDCTSDLSGLDLNQTQFSTPDADNDRHLLGNCAADYQSGWWFTDCFRIDLNGVYDSTNPIQGCKFTLCWGHNVPLQASRMRIMTERDVCNYPSMKPPWMTSSYLLCKY